MHRSDLDNLIKTMPIEDDCCGKWDLDFPLLYCSTRGWNDNTAKCHFFVMPSADDGYSVLESDYIFADSKPELAQNCRQWYIDNYKLAIKKILEDN